MTAEIKIELFGDWAVGKKPEERIVVTNADNEVSIDPQYNVRLHGEPSLDSKGYQVMLGDKSWETKVSDITNPVGIMHGVFELDGNHPTAQINHNGRKLAEITYIP